MKPIKSEISRTSQQEPKARARLHAALGISLISANGMSTQPFLLVASGYLSADLTEMEPVKQILKKGPQSPEGYFAYDLCSWAAISNKVPASNNEEHEREHVERESK